MKICILSSYYYPVEPGGAERSVRILAESLAADGHDVSVICLGTHRTTDLHNGVRIFRLPIRNFYLPSEHGGDRGVLQRLVWHARDTVNRSAEEDVAVILRKLQPDVMHTNNLAGFSVAVWDAAKDVGVRVVHTTRDFYLLCPRTTMRHAESNCQGPCWTCEPFARPRRAATPRVDHLVGVSRFMVDLHTRNGFFPGVPASVIHNSYDLPVASLPPRVNHPGIVLGYLGRLARSKGVELMIEAFRQVHQRHSATRLAIAGTGNASYVDELKRLASGLPVEFLGQVSPVEFFPHIDITVVPSVWNEPLGRVVIESLVFERPVVATPVGGMPELIDGAAGSLAASATPDDLAIAINAQIDMDGAAARYAAKEAAKRFSSRLLVDAYERIYRAHV